METYIRYCYNVRFQYSATSVVLLFANFKYAISRLTGQLLQLIVSVPLSEPLSAFALCIFLLVGYFFKLYLLIRKQFSEKNIYVRKVDTRVRSILKTANGRNTIFNRLDVYTFIWISIRSHQSFARIA